MIPYSGAAEIGGNGYLLEADGTRLLLDCGTGARAPDWVRDVPALDACWISHAHLDHVGALPQLLERFPALEGLATPTTARLAALSLGTRDNVDGGRAEAAATLLQPAGWRRWRRVQGKTGPPMRVMPFRAGHMPGAAMCLVEIQTTDIEREGGDGPLRVFYTSDFCCHDLPATPGAQFPQPTADFSIDVLVMEGMLATDEVADGVDVAEELGGLVEVVSATKGPVLVGVQALAESVEVAAALYEAEVSFAVHRYVAPIFEACAADLPFNPDEIPYVGRRDARSILRADGCVIAPGDQLKSGTPAGGLVGEIVENPNASIIVLNRAYGKTPAGRLLGTEAGGTLAIKGRTRTRRAQVKRFNVPTHAPRWQLLGAVDALEPDRVVLVHGRESRLYTLRRALMNRGYEGQIDVAKNGEPLALA